MSLIDLRATEQSDRDEPVHLGYDCNHRSSKSAAQQDVADENENCGCMLLIS